MSEKYWWGVPSFKSDVKTSSGTDSNKNSISVSTWDVYTPTSNTVLVDLSKYAKTKDNYLMIKTDFDTDKQSYVIKIPASDVLKTAYNKKNSEMTFKGGLEGKTDLKGTGSDALYVDASNPIILSFSTESESSGEIRINKNGLGKIFSDNTGTNDVTEQYQMSGASLSVTIPGGKSTTKDPISGGAAGHTLKTAAMTYKKNKNASAVDVYYVKSDGTADAQAKVYTFDAKTSKPAKLNVSKLAAAPKLTVDYLKGTIKLPKGTFAEYVSSVAALQTKAATDGNVQYDVGTDKEGMLTIGAGTVSGSVGSETYTTVQTSFADSKAVIDAQAPFAIDIYTKAVSGDKGKMKSRTGRYIFKAQAPTLTKKLNNGSDADGAADCDAAKSMITVEAFYKNGGYNATVKSKDAKNKYMITYKNSNGDWKTATTTLATLNQNDTVKTPGTASLSKIKMSDGKIADTIKVVCVGNKKTFDWLGQVEIINPAVASHDLTTLLPIVVMVVSIKLHLNKNCTFILHPPSNILCLKITKDETKHKVAIAISSSSITFVKKSHRV